MGRGLAVVVVVIAGTRVVVVGRDVVECGGVVDDSAVELVVVGRVVVDELAAAGLRRVDSPAS